MKKHNYQYHQYFNTKACVPLKRKSKQCHIDVIWYVHILFHFPFPIPKHVEMVSSFQYFPLNDKQFSSAVDVSGMEYLARTWL